MKLGTNKSSTSNRLKFVNKQQRRKSKLGTSLEDKSIKDQKKNFKKNFKKQQNKFWSEQHFVRVPSKPRCQFDNWKSSSRRKHGKEIQNLRSQMGDMKKIRKNVKLIKLIQLLPLNKLSTVRESFKIKQIQPTPLHENNSKKKNSIKHNYFKSKPIWTKLTSIKHKK